MCLIKLLVLQEDAVVPPRYFGRAQFADFFALINTINYGMHSDHCHSSAFHEIREQVNLLWAQQERKRQNSTMPNRKLMEKIGSYNGEECTLYGKRMWTPDLHTPMWVFPQKFGST